MLRITNLLVRLNEIGAQLCISSIGHNHPILSTRIRTTFVYGVPVMCQTFQD